MDCWQIATGIGAGLLDLLKTSITSWPFAAVILAAIFSSPIASLVHRIIEIKYRDVSILLAKGDDLIQGELLPATADPSASSNADSEGDRSRAFRERTQAIQQALVALVGARGPRGRAASITRLSVQAARENRIPPGIAMAIGNLEELLQKLDQDALTDPQVDHALHQANIILDLVRRASSEAK